MDPKEISAALTRVVSTFELMTILTLVNVLWALLGAVFMPLVEDRLFLGSALWFALLCVTTGGLVKVSRAGRAKLDFAVSVGQGVWDASSVIGGAFVVSLFGGILQSEWNKGLRTESLALFAVPTLIAFVVFTMGLVRYGRYARALVRGQHNLD